uniref:Uncharacterized protein n=1 Tax=Arundo donax TaxID=35708 RepID=A0A0A9BAE0_ARUDO
MQDPSKVAHV